MSHRYKSKSEDLSHSTAFQQSTEETLEFNIYTKIHGVAIRGIKTKKKVTFSLAEVLCLCGFDPCSEVFKKEIIKHYVYVSNYNDKFDVIESTCLDHIVNNRLCLLSQEQVIKKLSPSHKYNIYAIESYEYYVYNVSISPCIGKRRFEEKINIQQSVLLDKLKDVENTETYIYNTKKVKHEGKSDTVEGLLLHQKIHAAVALALTYEFKNITDKLRINIMSMMQQDKELILFHTPLEHRITTMALDMINTNKYGLFH